jgi:hypothetical protein
MTVSPEPANLPAGRSTAFYAALAFIVIAAAALYFWILGQNHRSGYYLPFTDGYTKRLAAGHYDMAEDPDPRLLALKDPYDPRQNSQSGALFDASFYRGRYYVYFGITPFATVLVPWYLGTGRVIPVDTATGLYALGGLVASVGCLLLLRKAWLPGGGRAAVLLAATVLAFGTPVLLLLRRPEIYELEIAAGSFHVALALCLAAAALVAARYRTAWIAAASLSLGLAAGCRPNCVLLAPVFVAWAAMGFGEPGPGPRRRAGPFLAALLPLGAAGMALAWFNWVRFGNPLEFGFRYQLVSYDRIRVGFWSFRNIAYNLHRYLLGGARLRPYFPFFMGESPGPMPLPAGHEATDQVYGCLLFCPFLWLLLGLLSPAQRHSPLGKFALFATAIAGADFALFLVMGNGAYRYLADFVPPALLAAGVVLLGLADGAMTWWRKGLLWLSVTLLAAFTCAAALLAQFSLYEIFRSGSPREFSTLSRLINTPVYSVQESAGLKPKVPYLDVVFPKDRGGQVEPLFVCGAPALQDFLYVYYSSPGHVRIGFESIGHGGPLSAEIPVDYSAVHELILGYGSFIPPDGHPLIRDLSAAEIGDFRTTLRVTLDGLPVLESRVEFHDPKDLLYWGESPDDAAFGRRFTGTLRRHGFTLIHVTPVPLRNKPSGYGAYSVTTTLADIPVGARVPILSAGYHPLGSVVYLERRDEGHALLGLASSGHPVLSGTPIALDPATAHYISVELGALYPPLDSPAWPKGMGASVRADLKNHVRLGFDGTPSLDAAAATGDASPSSVAIGANTVGITGIAPTLQGEYRGAGPEGLEEGAGHDPK